MLLQKVFRLQKRSLESSPSKSHLILSFSLVYEGYSLKMHSNCLPQIKPKFAFHLPEAFSDFTRETAGMPERTTL